MEAQDSGSFESVADIAEESDGTFGGPECGRVSELIETAPIHPRADPAPSRLVKAACPINVCRHFNPYLVNNSITDADTLVN